MRIPSDLTSLSYRELQILAKQNGLKASGKKNLLLQRLKSKRLRQNKSKNISFEKLKKIFNEVEN